MGGAPWRSNGCNTCRKRKVKCDFQRPQCARCLRGGHRCDGYERDRKFIHTFGDPGGSSNDGLITLDQRDDPGFTVININSQIRSQIFSLFIDSYVPSSPTGQIKFRCEQGSALVKEFPAMMAGKNSQLFDRAISALASVFVGKHVGDDRLMNHGLVLYNQAIHIFSRIISRSALPVQEVLCANVVFQLYEVINCTLGFAGWMAHMQGANAVIAKHYKSLERNELSKMLLRQLKLSNIFHAIGKSKSAQLFCPMWQVLSPAVGCNDPVDEIIDILMKCTTLVENMGAAKSRLEADRLEASCWNLKRQTEAWYKRLQATSPEPLYTLTSSITGIPRLNSATKNLFPHTFKFADLDIAETHMLCWTALLIMSTFFYDAERRKEAAAQALVTTPVSDDASAEDLKGSELFIKEAEFYANQICRGVGYFVQPHMNILGGHSLLFPVAMTSQFFHLNGFKEKYQWCQEVFAALEATGLGLASVLLGTPWSRYKMGEG